MSVGHFALDDERLVRATTATAAIAPKGPSSLATIYNVCVCVVFVWVCARIILLYHGYGRDESARGNEKQSVRGVADAGRKKNNLFIYAR